MNVWSVTEAEWSMINETKHSLKACSHRETQSRQCYVDSLPLWSFWRALWRSEWDVYPFCIPLRCGQTFQQTDKIIAYWLYPHTFHWLAIWFLSVNAFPHWKHDIPLLKRTFSILIKPKKKKRNHIKKSSVSS